MSLRDLGPDLIIISATKAPFCLLPHQGPQVLRACVRAASPCPAHLHSVAAWAPAVPTSASQAVASWTLLSSDFLPLLLLCPSGPENPVLSAAEVAPVPWLLTS